MNAVLRSAFAPTLLFVLAACSGSPQDETGESDIRRRVNPSSGSAGFELKKPAWFTDAFRSAFGFDGSAAEYDTVYERADGNFNLVSGVLVDPGQFGFGTRRGYLVTAIPLQTGFISIYEPAGFVIKYAQPINAGHNVVSAQRQGANAIRITDELNGAAPGYGYSVVMLDGTYTLTTTADAPQTFTVAEGEKKEIILPTAKVDFQFETVDPEFPGTHTCLSASAVASVPGNTPATDQLTVERGKSYTVPAGAYASLEMWPCGGGTSVPLPPNAVHTIAVHRLEVNDVDVVGPDGQHRLARGTFTVERKFDNGTYFSVFRDEPTHTGVDLTEGTYRVTSVAPNAPPHVQEITF